MFDVNFSFDSQGTEVTVRLDTLLMRQVLAHAEARETYHGRELDGIRVVIRREEQGHEPSRAVVIGIYKHGEVEYPMDEYGSIGWPDRS